MNVPGFARRVVRLAVIGLLTACGSSTQDQTAQATAVIGPAGGTVSGPDGVQVVVPSGALDQQTTISIARSSAGAPAPQPASTPPGTAIYEFAPHGLVFNMPVTIRMPMPPGATESDVFMARLGEGWQVNGATVAGGYAELNRNSFSWGMVPGACFIPAGNTDPYWCSSPWGYATASATPASALTQRTPANANGNAGSWVVNQAATVLLTLNYFAAPDCGNASVTLTRWNPALPANTPGTVQTLINNQLVALTPIPNTPGPGAGFASAGGSPTFRGVGSTTVDVSAYLTDTTNAFGFSFSCQRPNTSQRTAGDLITIVGPMPAPAVRYTIGGTVSNLTGSGLVLQNNGGDNLPVSANGSFSFATAVAPGTTYNVTVMTQPSGQTCTVQNGTGTANGNITAVAVNCSTLAISPTVATAAGCSRDTVVFTASGGAPPYAWSSSEANSTNLTVTSPTTASWKDGNDNFCSHGGTVTITVTDSSGATASATLTVQ